MLSDSHGPKRRRRHQQSTALACSATQLVEGTVQFSGRTLLFVDGKELGPVPCLAICENKKLAEVLLFHRDSEWNTLGCSAHPSVAEAKARAEGIYAGISTRWVEAGVSEQTAEACLNEQFGNERCSFCGKRPDEVDQMILKEDQRKHEVRICDRCINEFYKELPK